MDRLDQSVMTAEEAARALDIKLSTLYAYVSRNLIRSVNVDGSRKRAYLRVDVDGLRANRSASTQGTDALIRDSQLTLVTERGLYYRGHDVTKLATEASFEHVAALLWDVSETDVFGAVEAKLPSSFRSVFDSVKHLPVAEQALVLFPLIEPENPRAYDLSAKGFARTGAEVLYVFASIMCGTPLPASAPLHSHICKTLDAPDRYAELVRALLVLSADHQLDPSTYAVRAVANTGVTPYQAVMAGLVSSRGRRLTWGKREVEISSLLTDVLQTDDARAAVVRRFRNGSEIVGFSDDPEVVEDPRATHFEELLTRTLESDPEFARLRLAVEAVFELAGLRPSWGLYGTFVGYKLGLIGNESSVSLLGRMAGWIAHASEQYNSQDLVRTKVVYSGKSPVDTD